MKAHRSSYQCNKSIVGQSDFAMSYSANNQAQTKAL